MASSNGYQQQEKKQAQEDAKKSWREQLKDLSNAYGNIPDAFRLVWAASPGTTMVMLVLTLAAVVVISTSAAPDAAFTFKVSIVA